MYHIPFLCHLYVMACTYLCFVIIYLARERSACVVSWRSGLHLTISKIHNDYIELLGQPDKIFCFTRRGNSNIANCTGPFAGLGGVKSGGNNSMNPSLQQRISFLQSHLSQAPMPSVATKWVVVEITHYNSIIIHITLQTLE